MTDKPVEGPLDEDFPRESRRQLATRLLRSGADAPKLAVETMVKRIGDSTAFYAENARGRQPDADVSELVDRVIKSHVMLARSEGAATAAATTALELSSVVGTAGTLTPASAATGLIADLAGLTWIQVRMVLIVAALHGHDPRHPDRMKEIFSLMGVYSAQREATSLAGAGSQRVIRRLILRHLKGDALKAIKGMFRVVGINFNRTGLMKIVPGVNVPISVVMNGSATAALGRKANRFYGELPA